VAALSTYLENALLNETLRNVGYTPAATVYLALYTTNPTVADSGTEVTGGSYARPSVAFAAASGGICTNSALITITNMPAVTVTYMGIRDAATAGNLLYFGALSTAKTLNAGDAFVVQVGDLSVALS
jgi:hypothetical protein